MPWRFDETITSGTGFSSIFILEISYKYLGIDISKTMLSINIEKFYS